MKRKKKSRSAVRAAGKASPRKKKTAKKAKSPKKAHKERRVSPRLSPANLWVREVQGDFQFTSQVRDISMGGVFLKKRIQSPGKQTSLILANGEGHIEIEATVVRDELASDSVGTAYRFDALSKEQLRSLRSLLRNLD